MVSHASDQSLLNWCYIYLQWPLPCWIPTYIHTRPITSKTYTQLGSSLVLLMHKHNSSLFQPVPNASNMQQWVVYLMHNTAGHVLPFIHYQSKIIISVTAYFAKCTFFPWMPGPNSRAAEGRLGFDCELYAAWPVRGVCRPVPDVTNGSSERGRQSPDLI